MEKISMRYVALRCVLVERSSVYINKKGHNSKLSICLVNST